LIIADVASHVGDERRVGFFPSELRVFERGLIVLGFAGEERKTADLSFEKKGR
jgi:hypothetical protein